MFGFPYGIIATFPAVEAAVASVPWFLLVGAVLLFPSAVMAALFRKPSWVVAFVKYYLAGATTVTLLWGLSLLSSRGIGQLIILVYAAGVGFFWNYLTIHKLLAVFAIGAYWLVATLLMLVVIAGIIVAVNFVVHHTIQRLFPRSADTSS